MSADARAFATVILALVVVCAIVYSWGYRDGTTHALMDSTRPVKCESSGEFVK